jgi:DNA-binding NarL/FixJ family response regulator
VPTSLTLPPSTARARRLVGRGEALAAAAAHLAAGTSVTVIGRHGSGRTRMLDELRRRQAGPTLALTATRRTATVPLGVLTDGVPELGDLTDLGLADARRVVVRRLRELAAGDGLLVTVDDAEHLDPTTATGLREAVLALPWCRVVLAMGPHGVPAAARRASEPTAPVALPSLAAIDVERLAADELGGPIDVSLAAELVRRCCGLPRVVVELLRGARETGAVTFDGQVWHGAPPLPLHRLADLLGPDGPPVAAEVRELLEVLAVAGPLPEPVVAALTSAGRAQELDAGGLATWRWEDGRRHLTVRDPIDAEVVLAGLDPDQRRRRITRLLGAVDRAGGGIADPVRVAAWWLEVGGGDAALLELAARRAYAAGDYRAAGRFADAAMSRGAGPKAAMAAGAAAVEVGRLAEGERLLAAAVAGATDEAERAWSTIALAHARGVAAGAWAEAGTLLQELRPSLREATVRADVDAFDALLDALLGRIEPVRSRLRQLLAAGHGASIRSDRADRLLGASAALIAAEAPAAPEVAAALTVGAAAVRDGDPAAAGALPLAAPLLRAAGWIDAPPDDRYREAVDALDAVRPGTVGDEVGWWSLEAGRAALQAGRTLAAVDRLEAAARHLGTIDSLGLRPFAVLHLARSQAWLGACEQARASLASLGSDASATPRLATWVDVAVAELAVLSGDRDATALAAAAARRAGREGRADAALAATEALLVTGDGRGAARLLEQVGAQARPDEVTSALAAADALRTGSSATLAAAARALASHGRRRLAAEVAGHALARGADGRVRALCQGLATTGGAGWVATVGPVAPVVLSPRVRAVTRGAAAGRGRTALAAELGVSPRTVQNQLSRAYGVLGVRGRRELTACYPLDLPPLAPAHDVTQRRPS